MYRVAIIQADVIATIYEAVGSDEAFNALPAAMASVAGARSGIVQFFTPDWEVIEASVAYFSPAMLDRYVNLELYRLDPWRGPGIHTGGYGRIVGMDEAVPVEDLVGSFFYQENFRYWGDNTGRCIGGVVSTSGGFATIGLHRAVDADPFTPAEVAAVQPLVPHFTRMAGLRSHLRSMGARSRLTDDILNRQPDAILVVDAAGRPHFLNQAARALLDRGEVIRLRRGVVIAQHDTEAPRLRELIVQACCRSGAHGGGIALPRAQGRPLRLLVSPLAAGSRTHALLVLNDPDRVALARHARLQDLYRLTSVEAQTAAALAQGYSPAYIAERRGVSITTVRTQIRAILHKTEAGGIADVVALVASLPA